eukprot:Phypoly_transcript_16404.p1 GENE.Phypoly_transcript_16404~~Phypoly_transcript_16404.p1  ORF type:complete len:254 (+),score=50.84 Phypoly_transcript_16404:71-763(+)
MTSVVFAADPAIPMQTLSEPFEEKEEKFKNAENPEKRQVSGQICVLQMVGITAADHALIRKATGKTFLAELATTNPLWITNMSQDPIASNEERSARLLAIQPDIDAHLTDARMTVTFADNTVTIGLSEEARTRLGDLLVSALPKRKIQIINNSTTVDTDKIFIQEALPGTIEHIEKEGKTIKIWLSFVHLAGLQGWCKGQGETYTFSHNGKTCVFGNSLDTSLIPLHPPN